MCWTVAFVLCLTASAAGQIERLPATVLEATPAPSPAVQAAYTGQVADVIKPPDESPSSETAEMPLDARPGMFQKAILSYGWLARTGDSGMGINEAEAKLVLALPCPTTDWPLLLIPGYAIHLMDGPANVEMPPRLNDAYLQLRWLHRFSPAWGMDLSVTPGVYSDFEQSSSDAFRVTGYGAAAFTWTPTTKLIFGVADFNRLTVSWLPIGGVIWTPTEDCDFEVLFPQPKLAYRLSHTPPGIGAVETWAYLAAEFGGGIWAFAQSDGTPNLVDFRDYRLYVGLERKVTRGLDARIEAGYVFGRKIQYQNSLPEFSPTDTVMVRGGLSY